MKRKKRILVAPLDWGIGHATRCIPLINALLENFEVVIAADNRPLHLLKLEFPKLEFIRFPDYNIKYHKYLPMGITILLQAGKILFGIQKEQKIIDEIIESYNIDGIISDNRFGLSTKKIPCVFMTHQLEIQSPFFMNIIQKLNYSYINKYNACWVVDSNEKNLAGRLSKPKKLPKNTIYINTLSRFKKKKVKKKYDFLAIISGPEPQRTIFENGLTKALLKRNENAMIVLGKPEKKTHKKINNLTIISHLKSEELNLAILESELVICRSGYSTIMDLEKLEKKAFLIPTPGQTEQEYLANQLHKKKICYSQKQTDFNFEKGINESKKYKGFKNTFNEKTKWEDLFSLFQE